jgi:hypothetical protein
MVFDPANVIPVATFVLVLGIIIVVNLSRYHTRKLQSEERLAAIAKGLPLPAETAFQAALSDPIWGVRALRRRGIILISTGIGLGLFSWVLAMVSDNHQVLVVAGAGLIPLMIGVGLLFDYWLQMRELKRGDETHVQ